MTSIVDKYYRRIIQNIDNVKMKFDISALLVKSKEHDSKIDTNRNNISSNYNISQINKKKSEFNTSLIDTNKNNISSNLSKINSIEENNSKYSVENFFIMNIEIKIIILLIQRFQNLVYLIMIW